MSGESLSECGIPELQNLSPSVIEFGIDRRERLFRRVVVFVLTTELSGVVCGLGIVLSFGDWYGFTLLSAFYVVFSSIIFFILFGSSSLAINTDERTLARTCYLGNWNYRTLIWQMTDDDKFTVYLSTDYYETSADHLVHLTSNHVDHYLCKVTLPDVSPSQGLIERLNFLAKKLRIGHARYGSKATYFWRRLTPRW